MASSSTTTPLLSCSPSSINDLQRHWLTNSTNTFLNHLHKNTHVPICIFQLPDTLTSQKPDSYIPQHVGLGPLHHFRTDLYSKQEQLKITTTKTFLNAYNMTPEFHKIVHDKVTDLVPAVRCCYELYLDIDDQCLSWLFVIDALFLLDVLSKVGVGDRMESLQDFIMLENQIPLVILEQLVNLLHEQSTSEFKSSFLSNLLVKFCEKHSPLKFKTDGVDICNTFHLLDCMYKVILKHDLRVEEPRISMFGAPGLDDVVNFVEVAGEYIPGANVVLRPASVFLKLPWEKITNLIKKMLGENPTMPEISIPSVSKLSKIGNIEFLKTPGGIYDIEFNVKKPSFTLPVLDLKQGSEAVLRNLVAYEELRFKNDNSMDLGLTEYVDFMCGIIDGVKDVKILRDKSIIEGSMHDEDIVKLFNGITKSSVRKDGNKSELQKTILKVNAYYGNIPRVKVCNFIKKAFLASWKIFAIVFTVLSAVLTVVTTVCQVYNCKGSFGLGHIRSILDYVTPGNQL